MKFTKSDIEQIIKEEAIKCKEEQSQRARISEAYNKGLENGLKLGVERGKIEGKLDLVQEFRNSGYRYVTT